ncbi:MULTISPECIES: PE domain-containing protein [Amycolatopsis]|uniref:PE domain-containing protein n=1 Tax=Amycolatopsis albidoflavus TaxID=102226 RepID=A0ABW5IFN8_9PSEU
MADSQQSRLPPARRYGGESIETMAIAPLLGDGYAYDEKTLRELEEIYKNLAEKYHFDQLYARVVEQTQPPAGDFSSTDNATVFQRSGLALQASLRQCEQYCRDQVAKYHKALGKYTAAEDAHSAELGKSGGSL